MGRDSKVRLVDAECTGVLYFLSFTVLRRWLTG